MLFVPAHAERVAVRMYCQGFGDCFLLAFREGPKTFYVLIDCGVVRNTKDEKARMREVVQDVFEATGGALDVVVVTHEHYDHVCGFAHAKDVWEKFTIGALWLPWTENLADPLARQIAKYRQDAFGLLMQGTGALDAEGGFGMHMDSLLGLLPAYSEATGRALQTIVDIAKGQGVTPTYLEPGNVVPIPSGYAAALGPPKDLAKIKDLEGTGGDTFRSMAMLAADENATEGGSYEGRLRRELGLPPERRDLAPPFSEMYVLDESQGSRWEKGMVASARSAGSPSVADLYADPDAAWRRIDEEHLARFEGLALQLDSLTNNISLALAFVVGEDVLLFPGDAQMGNWKSWGDQKYALGDRTKAVEDLMDAVRIYKAGHHASHNGTCRPERFDRMPVGTRTLVPFEKVDRWPSIPAAKLIEALVQKGPVARVDQAGAAPEPFRTSPNMSALTGRPLFVEVGI